MGHFEFFDHTADVGMRLRGQDWSDLLAAAVAGLSNLIVPDPAAIQPRETRAVEIEGDEEELLLFDLLNHALYLFEAERWIVGRAKIVSATDRRVSAELLGEPFDPDRHPEGHEVKAVTYHGLFVEHDPAGWRAEVIFDI